MNEKACPKTPLTTFILEDDDFVRHLLRRIVEATPGLCVSGEAVDIPEALAALKERPPGIAVLDLNLPSGSGLEVLELIRSTPSDCRVIVFSGNMGEKEVAQCRQAGADHCYRKPLQLKDLRQTLSDYGNLIRG